MTKKEIDALIASIISLKAQKKVLEQKIDEQVAEIEQLYKFPKEKFESIVGYEYEAKKVIVDKGKNKFSLATVEQYLEALPEEVGKDIIVTTREVDPVRFNKLVEDGYITEDMLDQARKHKYTMYTKFDKRVSALKSDARELKKLASV